MSIYQIYIQVVSGDEDALESLIVKFHPLMVKKSLRNGVFDEDCYQECVMAVIQAVDKFVLRN